MRCALSFDESKSLYEQSLSAWGEMQSLKEDPAYRESDIKGVEMQECFKGYKSACDFFDNLVTNMLYDEMIDESAYEHIESCLCGELAMRLFVILDHQYAEEEDNEEAD